MFVGTFVWWEDFCFGGRTFILVGELLFWWENFYFGGSELWGNSSFLCLGMGNLLEKGELCGICCSGRGESHLRWTKFFVLNI